MDYDDITLLECNRQASVQARSGNDTDPAIFTVKLGNTVELEEGDQISVESAFISEDGAGGDGIEFKGDPIRNEGGNKSVTVDYEFTRVETTYNTSWREIGNNAVVKVLDPDGNAKNTVVSKQLYDNKLFIEVTFFKSNNGESCFMMPRRWLYNSGDSATAVFDQDDAEALGQAFFLPTEEEQVCTEDYTLKTDNSFKVGGHTRTYYRPKHDNKRFTMFMKTETYRYSGTEPADYLADFGKDIMTKDYVEYKELKEINIKEGFNTPTSVAEQVTEQLQRVVNVDEVTGQSRPQPDVLIEDDNIHTPANAMPRRVLSTWHSNLYKPVFCFSSPVADETYFDAFLTPAGATSTLHVKYISAYQYIYVKRPDIFRLGRLCNDGRGFVDGVIVDGAKTASVPGFIKNTINPDSADPIVTQWEYTTENLENLNNLFMAQGNYPELFKNDALKVGDDYSRTIANARFLHINVYATNTATHQYEHQLGDDGIFDWSTIAEDTTHQSLAVFFKYDPSLAGVDTGGNHIANLSYGFATKTLMRDEHLDDGTKKYYITLHPGLFDDADERWMSFYFTNYGWIVPDSVQIGWDYHANSYGNVVMGGTNGLWKEEYDNAYKYGLMNIKPFGTSTAERLNDFVEKMNVMYIGANNPALKYDPDGSTFGWEYLHTVEHVGQAYNAGATSQRTGAGENTYPLVDDASNECYKINKRLQYSNFTPDMRPYLLQSSLVLGGTSANSYKTTVTNFNYNLEQWGLYDTQCGVYLNCGKTCPQSSWKESLLGILGFTYEQFNATTVNDNNNIQARINNNNKHDLDQLVTTNSQVVSTDTVGFFMNIWGGIQYGTQISPPLMINSWDVVS